MEELLQLIQYRTQAKRFAESAVHQSNSSIVAYAEKIVVNIGVAVRRPNSVDDVNESHFIQIMSALLRNKSVTIVRIKETTLECTDYKKQEVSRTEGKIHGKSEALLDRAYEEQESKKIASPEEIYFMQKRSRL